MAERGRVSGLENAGAAPQGQDVDALREALSETLLVLGKLSADVGGYATFRPEHSVLRGVTERAREHIRKTRITLGSEPSPAGTVRPEEGTD